MAYVLFESKSTLLFIDFICPLFNQQCVRSFCLTLYLVNVNYQVIDQNLSTSVSDGT